tara:strand:+ start:1312 stop:2712 length:1401 start_codon:yes stop_codon:yes gene_type:complete
MVEIKAPQIETIISGLTDEVLTQLAIKERGKATELLVEHIERNQKIYTTRDDVKTEMWIYQEGIYVPQGKSFIREYVRKILGQAYTGHICNEVIAKIETDTFINSEDFFVNKYLNEIPIENGILDIKKETLTPFTPSKIFFNKLPITYDPDAECPNIENHLKEVLKSEDDVKVFYEIVGFCLYKDYFLEKMVMFVGDGRNGKGKTIDLIRRFLGLSNCSSVPLASLSDNSFRVSELFGKMVNLAGDLSNTSLKETGMLKQTTGRDLIGAKRKFLNEIKFINYSKHIFACNDLPKVYDMSDGFWERWMVFEFPYKFIPKSEFDALKENEIKNHKLMDTDLINKISSPEELSGLLNKALEGLQRILQNKEFSYSTGSDEIKKMWVRKADSFIAFCYDIVEEDSQGMITKSNLRKAFFKYCKKHNLKGVSDKSIAITLQEMYGIVDSRLSDLQRTLIWEGIKLKTDWKI